MKTQLTALAGVALLVLAGCEDNTGAEDQEDTEAAEATEETKEAAEETEEESAPRYEVEEDGRDLIVFFDVAEGGGSATAQDAGWRALTWAVEEYPDHDGRYVLRAFRNDGDGMIVNAFYEQETIDAIDFDEFNRFELWEVRDEGMVNPALQD